MNLDNLNDQELRALNRLISAKLTQNKEDRLKKALQQKGEINTSHLRDFAKEYVEHRLSDNWHEDDELDWRVEALDRVLHEVYGDGIYQIFNERDSERKY